MDGPIETRKPEIPNRNNTPLKYSIVIFSRQNCEQYCTALVERTIVSNTMSKKFHEHEKRLFILKYVDFFSL